MEVLLDMYQRKTAPDGFTIYREGLKTILLLPDEKAGRVIKAATTFFLDGVEPENFDLAEQMAFAVLQEEIEKALQRFEDTCVRNQKNRTKTSNHLSPQITTCDHLSPDVTECKQSSFELNGREENKEEFKLILHRYGEYGWVKLTDKQHEKLVQELGEAELNRCIKLIDESAQSTGNKNRWKDWNLVIRRCHREGWGKNKTNDSGSDMSWTKKLYQEEE